MRLHIRQVPFDFITEENTKSSHRVAAAMVFLLVLVLGLLFLTAFSAFAAIA